MIGYKVHKTCWMRGLPLNKVSNIHRHLIDLGGIVLLNITQDPDVIVLHEVDGYTLATESARSSDSMDVQLSVVWQVVVDHQRDLLDINTPGPDISGDQDSALSTPELFHNRVSFFLWHVSVHGTDGKIGLPHLLSEPVHLTLSVAENYSLCDSQGVIQVTQGVKFPLFSLHSNEELLNSFQGQLVTLDKDPDGVRHELAGHLKDLVWQGGRNEAHLCGRWQVSIHIIDLL